MGRRTRTSSDRDDWKFNKTSNFSYFHNKSPRLAPFKTETFCYFPLDTFRNRPVILGGIHNRTARNIHLSWWFADSESVCSFIICRSRWSPKIKWNESFYIEKEYFCNWPASFGSEIPQEALNSYKDVTVNMTILTYTMDLFVNGNEIVRTLNGLNFDRVNGSDSAPTQW